MGFSTGSGTTTPSPSKASLSSPRLSVCPATSCPLPTSRRDPLSLLPRVPKVKTRRLELPLPPLRRLLLRLPQAWAEATDEVKKVQASATDSCRELLTRRVRARRVEQA